MAQFITKPNASVRDSLLLFGDGDEAIFLRAVPTQPGWIMMVFKPTRQMRWHYNILDEEYNPEDKWIYRQYKEDLCIPLSLDPDFPMWMVLCDYKGNENTMLYNRFIGLKDYISRNRNLERENRLLRTENNFYHRELRKISLTPKPMELSQLNTAKRWKDAVGSTTVYSTQGQPMPEQQNPG